MIDLMYRFENNYLLGCVKYKGKYNIYLMPIAWWILNYEKYDPGYNPTDWKDIFRDNILNVSEDAVEDFMKSIEADRIDLTELPMLVAKIPGKYMRLRFFIDFDLKLFVNGYYDNIAIEEYLPDESWRGRSDDPNSYLPKYLQDFFKG
jgi:hypothetical protein